MEDEFIQFAQRALIIKDNKLLIIRKSSQDKNNPNRYDIPGGRKQIGENLEEHIAREVKEEVGMDIQPRELFDMWEFSIPVDGKKTTIVSVARFCEILDYNIKITEEAIDKYEWVEINKDLLNYNFIPGIRKTIEKLIKLQKKY